MQHTLIDVEANKKWKRNADKAMLIWREEGTSDNVSIDHREFNTFFKQLWQLKYLGTNLELIGVVINEIVKPANTVFRALNNKFTGKKRRGKVASIKLKYKCYYIIYVGHNRYSKDLDASYRNNIPKTSAREI